MRTSTVFAILGVVAISGYAIYKYWELTNRDDYDGKKEKTETNSEFIKNQCKSEILSTQVNMNSDETLSDVVENLESQQSDIKNDIIQRHEVAAKIMKDSMEHILSEDNIEVPSENAEDLDEIEDALDKLFDE